MRDLLSLNLVDKEGANDNTMISSSDNHTTKELMSPSPDCKMGSAAMRQCLAVHAIDLERLHSYDETRTSFAVGRRHVRRHVAFEFVVQCQR